MNKRNLFILSIISSMIQFSGYSFLIALFNTNIANKETALTLLIINVLFLLGTQLFSTCVLLLCTYYKNKELLKHFRIKFLYHSIGSSLFWGLILLFIVIKREFFTLLISNPKKEMNPKYIILILIYLLIVAYISTENIRYYKKCVKPKKSRN